MAKNKSGTMSRMRTIGILLVSVLLVSVCAAEILAQAEPAGALLALEAGSLNTGSSEAPGSDAGNPEAGSSGTGSAESGSIETGSSEVEGTEPGQSEAGDVPDGAKQGGTGSDSVKVDVEPGTGDGMQPGAAGGTEPGDGADAEPGEGVGTESGTEPGVEAGAEPGAEGNTQPGTEPAEDSGGNPETEPVAEQLGITAEGNRYEGSLMGVITGTSTNKHLKALYAWITLDGEIFVAFAFYNNNVFNKNIENLRYDGVILFPNLERQSPEQGTDYWYETELVVNNVALTRPDWAVCWLVVNYGRQTF
ncbi:MAG TPA: hypothetical protein GX529_02260, partial [Firmicutes bacterium]|nr:hypothetical protein [Candidatus Fermentithermobacillaceae bacterium]